MKHRLNIYINFSIKFFFSLILLYPYYLEAQVAKDDIRKINEVFSSDKGISLELTYNVFASDTSDKSLSCKKAIAQRMGDNQLYSISGLEILTNAKYRIVTSREERTIIVNEINKKHNDNAIPINLDSSLKSFSSVEFKKINDQLYCYCLKPKGTEFSEVDLYFHPLTYYIDKIVLYSRMPMDLENHDDKKNDKREKPRMEIKFDKISIGKINPRVFSEGNYVLISGTKVACQPRFHSYKLINNLRRKVSAK